MGRTKKTRGPEELLKSMNESTEEKTRPYIDIKSLSAEDSELDEVNEADDVELDEADSDPDKTTELDLTAAKKKAAKKPRSSRKRKEPVVVDEDITAVLEPKLDAAPQKEIKKEAAPKVVVETVLTEPVTAVVPPRARPQDDHLREDVSIASASLHKTMESMVHQWGSVKEISGSICQELERVNTMLKMPAPQADPVDIKEYLKQAAPRITLANKIALGVSAAAVVFSILSLSLASSTRHRLLEQSHVPAVAFERRQAQPVRPVQQVPVIAPKAVEAPVVVLTPPAPAAPVIEQLLPKVPVKSAKEMASAELAKQPILSAPKPRVRKAILAAKERHGRSSRRSR